MCLSPATIIVFKRKALKKFGGFGGMDSIRNRSDLEKLSEYVEYAGNCTGGMRYGNIALPFIRLSSATPSRTGTNAQRDMSF